MGTVQTPSRGSEYDPFGNIETPVPEATRPMMASGVDASAPIVGSKPLRLQSATNISRNALETDAEGITQASSASALSGIDCSPASGWSSGSTATTSSTSTSYVGAAV